MIIQPHDTSSARQVANLLSGLDQIPVRIEQFIHAGVYCRTAYMPANSIVVGVKIVIPTLLVIHGDTEVDTGDGIIRLVGHHHLMGAAGRQQVFRTYTDTVVTMMFHTEAKTVQEAEEEFTREAHLLTTRKESPCLEY